MTHSTDLIIPYTTHLAVVHQYEREACEMQVVLNSLTEQLLANERAIQEITLHARAFKEEHQAAILRFELANANLQRMLQELQGSGSEQQRKLVEAHQLIDTLSNEIKQLSAKLENPDPRVLVGRCYQLFKKPFWIASSLLSFTLLFYRMVYRASPQPLSSEDSLLMVKSFWLATQIDPAHAFDLAQTLYQTFRR